MKTELDRFKLISLFKSWDDNDGLEAYGRRAATAYTNQGTLVAFGLNFPQNTAMIPIDESHITALSMGSRGFVYGGTSGVAAHLFVGMFSGINGAVLDLGTINGADTSVAVCCGPKKVAIFTNGPAGGCITLRGNEPINFDLIQEWFFMPQPLESKGEVIPGEKMVHAVAIDDGKKVIGATEKHLFAFDFETEKVSVIGECNTTGRLAVQDGAVYGRDDKNALWKLDLAGMKLTRNAVALPKGNWEGASLVWAKDPNNGTLYTADAEGSIFPLKNGAFGASLGKTLLAPVTSMAVTFDGRIFGTCGTGIGKHFGLNPGKGEVENLGVAVSVIHRRRYGYQFADAVVGRDGQIYFGENDNLGHIWIYFPSIQRPRA